MTELKLVVFMLLALRCWAAAGAYTAPPWACSPAPHASNPLCPGPARGDSRCSRQGCTPDAGCARQECNAVQGAISGTVVVQDAWLSIRGSSCKKTQWTLSECCALCQESPRCNAWSFCNDPNGCGTGCVARVHKHVAAETPVYTISPMTYTRRLNPEHSCTAAGAWPYGTCSLLYVDGPARPEAPPLMKDAKANIGWVSGIVSKAVSAEVSIAALPDRPGARPEQRHADHRRTPAQFQEEEQQQQRQDREVDGREALEEQIRHRWQQRQQRQAEQDRLQAAGSNRPPIDSLREREPAHKPIEQDRRDGLSQHAPQQHLQQHTERPAARRERPTAQDSTHDVNEPQHSSAAPESVPWAGVRAVESVPQEKPAAEPRLTAEPTKPHAGIASKEPQVPDMGPKTQPLQQQQKQQQQKPAAATKAAAAAQPAAASKAAAAAAAQPGALDKAAAAAQPGALVKTAAAAQPGAATKAAAAAQPGALDKAAAATQPGAVTKAAAATQPGAPVKTAAESPTSKPSEQPQQASKPATQAQQPVTVSRQPAPEQPRGAAAATVAAIAGPSKAAVQGTQAADKPEQPQMAPQPAPQQLTPTQPAAQKADVLVQEIAAMPLTDPQQIAAVEQARLAEECQQAQRARQQQEQQQKAPAAAAKDSGLQEPTAHRSLPAAVGTRAQAQPQATPPQAATAAAEAPVQAHLFTTTEFPLADVDMQFSSDVPEIAPANPSQSLKEQPTAAGVEEEEELPGQQDGRLKATNSSSSKATGAQSSTGSSAAVLAGSADGTDKKPTSIPTGRPIVVEQDQTRTLQPKKVPAAAKRNAAAGMGCGSCTALVAAGGTLLLLLL